MDIHKDEQTGNHFAKKAMLQAGKNIACVNMKVREARYDSTHYSGG
jgi:hypothetical protein